MAESVPKKFVQTYGRKKTAIAIAVVTPGFGLINVNGVPLELIEPEPMRLKALEPVYLLGKSKFSQLNIRIRVRGGGSVSQIYAIRQAISKSIIAWHAKFIDEDSKNELRKALLEYDRSLLIVDPRRPAAKQFGGRGARARKQKSYR